MSGSHASPMPSLSSSACDGLLTLGQLSTLSQMPSLSLSTQQAGALDGAWMQPLAVQESTVHGSLSLQSASLKQADGVTHSLSTQTWPLPHAPQEPPQPSSPHGLPPHAGTHAATHACVCASHVVPGPHVPQEPPQPSSPQVLPLQLDAHAHWPFEPQ